jgi:hypothetical protein
MTKTTLNASLAQGADPGAPDQEQAMEQGAPVPEPAKARARAKRRSEYLWAEPGYLL